MIQKYGLVANPEIENTLNLSERIIEFFEGDILVESRLSSALKEGGYRVNDHPTAPLEKMKAEIIITVGGDGTILKTIQLTDAKILGIDAGNLGFMAEVPPALLDDALIRLKNGDYCIDRRLRVKTMLDGKRLPDSTNEAVIHTDRVAKIRSFSIEVDDCFVEVVRADGIIVATPTGSTSYSMSAGGPILDPRVEAFVLVSIAAFSRNIRRPLVVPPSSVVRITMPQRKTTLLVLDGQQEFHLEGEAVLEFTASEKPAEFIKMYSDFYANLRRKIQG